MNSHQRATSQIWKGCARIDIDCSAQEETQVNKTTSQKKIKFLVEIDYDNYEGGPVCETSMKENLQAAIEKMRMEGVLTPDDISAENLSVEVIQG